MNEYKRYGDEWANEVMRNSKSEIIAMLRRVAMERDVLREFVSDLRETLELHESHWSYHINKDLKHLDEDLAALQPDQDVTK